METRQRQYDSWASNLLFLAFGLSVLMGLLRHKGYFANDLQTKDYITLYLFTPITLVIYYYIRKGVRGAKTLFLVLYGLVILQIITGGLANVQLDTTLGIFDFFCQHLLQIVASILILLSLWPNKPAGSQQGLTN